MRPLPAILTTIGIFILIVFLSLYEPSIIWCVIIGTSIGVGFGTYRAQMYKYKLNGLTNPVIAVLGCLMLWIVFFPWYLINAGKIKRGEAVLKDKYVFQPIASAEKSDSHAATKSPDNYLAQLEKLAQLKEKGILSNEEFQSQKAKLLANE